MQRCINCEKKSQTKNSSLISPNIAYLTQCGLLFWMLKNLELLCGLVLKINTYLTKLQNKILKEMVIFLHSHLLNSSFYSGFSFPWYFIVLFALLNGSSMKSGCNSILFFAVSQYIKQCLVCSNPAINVSYMKKSVFKCIVPIL